MTSLLTVLKEWQQVVLDLWHGPVCLSDMEVLTKYQCPLWPGSKIFHKILLSHWLMSVKIFTSNQSLSVRNLCVVFIGGFAEVFSQSAAFVFGCFSLRL